MASIRRASTFNTGRIDHIYTDPHLSGTRLFLHYGDLSDGGQLTHIVYNIKPDEVYNLAAQSHVRVSFDMPEYTGDIVGLGNTRLLESIPKREYFILSPQSLCSSKSVRLLDYHKLPGRTQPVRL